MNKLYAVIRRTLPMLTLAAFLGVPALQQDTKAQLTITSPEGVALMAIYNDTDGANWVDNTNWGSATEPLDNWYGVTVADGKVTRLRLVTNNLTGTLPDVFGDLTDLTFLHLKENNLTGPVPASIGSLTNLTFLGLNDNDFSGDLPVGIGNLVNVTEMYVQMNGFTGTFPDISGLTSLKYLYLFDNEFTGVNAGIIGITSLRELLVNKNFLVFDDLIPLKNLASDRFVYAPQGLVGSPSSESLTVGDTFTQTVTLGGTNTYQWYKDLSAIGGATAATFSIASVALTDAGVYMCEIKNADLPLLTLETADVTLTVIDGPSVFPDWYVTTNADGDIEVIVDEPAATTPAITKAYIWAESFTGSAFEYLKYSPTLLFSPPALSTYVWESNSVAPGPLSGNDQTRRVKIQLEDASYATSDLSDMQQSIHLTVNQGNGSQINLIWTPYLGRDIAYYEVYGADDQVDLGFDPGPNTTGALLTTLPSTETTYTDFTGYDYYMVQAVFPAAPSLMKNDAFRASQSNRYSISEDGFGNIFQPKMKIYPNPVVNSAMIEFDNANNSEYTLYILDFSGKILRKVENITGSNYTLHRGDLHKGMYLLQMVGERNIHGKILID